MTTKRHGPPLADDATRVRPLTSGDAPSPPPTVQLPPTADASPPPAPPPQPLRPAVLDADFPDPSIVWGGDKWYAFATNSGVRNVQVSSSSDLLHWTAPVDAVPTLPPWAYPGFTWAPTVAPIGLQWVMYVSSSPLFGGECIDRLVSPSPGGPYTSVPGGPLVCTETGGSGAIDPFPFVAPDGAVYLLWKADAPRSGTLFGAPLTPDGMALAGPPRPLLDARSGWQHGVVENPSMVAANGTYWLVYSGASWTTNDYAMGVARCDTPLGPCTDQSRDGPWVATDGDVGGPGGGSLFTGPDQRVRIAYHAWSGPSGYRSGGWRALHVEPVDFGPGGPFLANRPPVGGIDGFTRTPTGVTIGGWALDPDSAAPSTVDVTVDGQPFAHGPATGDRPDVGGYPFTGTAHGFVFDLHPSDGHHHVCVDASDDTGTFDVTVVCQDIDVASTPFGSLDRAALVGAGRARVTGWAIAPDAPAPITVDLLVDGTYVTSVPATAPRPDVAAAYPAYGAGHGFDTIIAVPPGHGHTVCAYGAADDDRPAPRLGCSTV